MIGFIVKHGGEGLGKVFSIQNDQITVFFFTPPQCLSLVATIDGRQVLKRALLPLDTVCSTQEGRCRITNTIPAAAAAEPHRYHVEFADGLAKDISEAELVPIEIPRTSSPLEALADLLLEGYETFQKREGLVDARWSSVRGALGLHALLSSRIDLRPHQAYVAGAVLLDRLPRYLLADEVGLGKTIEAGIVIHDLLERKPSAKVLILCPGTLTCQWLCELYAKFCGRVFHLLEFRRRDAAAGTVSQQLIASFTAALTHGARLTETPWDLVVVDEAHHLLSAPRLYSLAQRLSESAPGCLLLSAIPVQRREDEYLRLLALLEPQRYDPTVPGAQTRFKALYDRQIELGRKLSYISRRLEEFAEGAGGADRIMKKLEELSTLPVLAEDQSLSSSVRVLDPTSPCFVKSVREVLHHVGDRYRISRRILRNRRNQLLDIELDLRISRRLRRLPHQPGQLELDARSAVRRLLQTLRSAEIPSSVLIPLSRQLFQSLCDPSCLLAMLALARCRDLRLANWSECDGQIGYDEWEDYAATLWDAAGPELSAEALDDAQRAADAWQAGGGRQNRVEKLTGFLRAQHLRAPSRKFLIFAGFPGLASRLTEAIVGEFGNPSVARFGWDMQTKIKEKEVIRFRRDNLCWIMVSDETGGEGRNFQFVDELIHFDLPWYAARIEQRIGRLDRLGREEPEVCSNVLFAAGEEEEGWLRCLESGLQLFARSISGLEFALAELERQIVHAAIADGSEGMDLLLNEIKQKAEAERAEDDVQGMLDAASIERASAEIFRRAQSTPDRDIALETAFCDYFRFIAGNGAVRFLRAGAHVEGVIEFRPDQLREVGLALAPAPNGGIPDRLGTFRRQIAQERPDLEFFSVGNEFFDAVCATLRQSSKARTYAVECLSPHAAWRGFEFSYRPIGRHVLLAHHPGLVKHLARVFAVRAEHCFIGDDLHPAQDSADLLNIRKSLEADGHDQTWWNFTMNNTRFQLLSDRYANPGWETLVKRAELLAHKQTKERLALSLSPALESERIRIAEQIRQAVGSKADGWMDEVAGLESLLRALNEWDLELDTAGYLSVNGGIIE